MSPNKKNQYLDKAVECEQRAKSVRDVTVKKVYKRCAREWRQLARFSESMIACVPDNSTQSTTPELKSDEDYFRIK